MSEHTASINEIFEAYIRIVVEIRRRIDKKENFVEYQAKFQWPLAEVLESCSVVSLLARKYLCQ